MSQCSPLGSLKQIPKPRSTILGYTPETLEIGVSVKRFWLEALGFKKSGLSGSHEYMCSVVVCAYVTMCSPGAK